MHSMAERPTQTSRQKECLQCSMIRYLTFLLLFTGHVFWEFDKFWFDEEPADIMQFGPMRDKFNRKMLHKLSKSQTILQSEFQKKE